jgi:hypothetical protein
VIDIVRAGDIMARKTEFAHSAWVVQGYAQAQIIGEPGVVSGPEVVAEPLAALEAAVAAEQEAMDGGTVAAIPIPWALIAAYLIKLLLKHVTDE